MAGVLLVGAGQPSSDGAVFRKVPFAWSVKWLRPDAYWLELENGNGPAEKVRVGNLAFTGTRVGETVPVWRNPGNPGQIAENCLGNLDRKVFPRWVFLLLRGLGLFVADLLTEFAL